MNKLNIKYHVAYSVLIYNKIWLQEKRNTKEEEREREISNKNYFVNSSFIVICFEF